MLLRMKHIHNIVVYLQEYVVKDELIVFKINLNVLLECLNILGVSNAPGVTPALTLHYDGQGSPLNLMWEKKTLF